MRKTFKAFIVITAAFLFICAAGVLINARTVTVCIQSYNDYGEVTEDDIELVWETENRLELKSIKFMTDSDGMNFACLTLTSDAPGEYFAEVRLKGEHFGYVFTRQRGPFLLFDEATGEFSGDNAIIAGALFYAFAGAFVMLRRYAKVRGYHFYSYDSIFSFGLGAFLLVTSLSYLGMFIIHLKRPETYNMSSVYTSITQSGGNFLYYLSPVVIISAILLIVSNIVLVKHEGMSLSNFFGAPIGLLMLGAVAFYFFNSSKDFQGSFTEYRVFNVINSTIGTFITYFVCILLGSVVCGIRAARHRPPFDRDYVIILGCGFRPDGTLTPLLRGRADKAVEFRNKQLEAVGKDLIFVPSGGQGSDEPMPEAEAIARYLISQGIPESNIIKEDRSINTLENMTFSKAIIDTHYAGRGAVGAEEPRTAYSTTNYHVFRSGIWARLAGLNAEGMGCRTKWWFWPNAFMRECLGLLQKKFKQELIGLVIVVAFFAGIAALVI